MKDIHGGRGWCEGRQGVLHRISLASATSITIWRWDVRGSQSQSSRGLSPFLSLPHASCKREELTFTEILPPSSPWSSPSRHDVQKTLLSLQIEDTSTFETSAKTCPGPTGGHPCKGKLSGNQNEKGSRPPDILYTHTHARTHAQQIVRTHSIKTRRNTRACSCVRWTPHLTDYFDICQQACQREQMGLPPAVIKQLKDAQKKAHARASSQDRTKVFFPSRTPSSLWPHVCISLCSSPLLSKQLLLRAVFNILEDLAENDVSLLFCAGVSASRDAPSTLHVGATPSQDTGLHTILDSIPGASQSDVQKEAHGNMSVSAFPVLFPPSFSPCNRSLCRCPSFSLRYTHTCKRTLTHTHTHRHTHSHTHTHSNTKVTKQHSHTSTKRQNNTATQQHCNTVTQQTQQLQKKGQTTATQQYSNTATQ